MSRTYRRDWWYGTLVNVKRPWTDHEIEQENRYRSGGLWYDVNDAWDVKWHGRGKTTLRALMSDRWTDKHSGHRNAPKHFRQVLNRKKRSRMNNELRTLIANRVDYEDFYLKHSRPKRDAAWLWF